MNTELKNFKLSQKDISYFGQGLVRPECVWADQDGVWVSDSRGGIGRVNPDKAPDLLGHGIAETNGFCRRANGNFIVSGLSDGTLYEITPAGEQTVLLDSLDGEPLGTVNHAWVDAQDRVWVSIMSSLPRWYDSLLTPEPEGSIILIDEKGPRRVADKINLTNEVKVSPDGKYLYVAETMSARIIRFPILPNGDLGARELVGPKTLGYGGFPDGFSFDGQGNVWVTLVCRNGLCVIDRDGEMHTIYDEPNMAALDSFMQKFEAREATPEDMGACAGAVLTLPTSLAFGGPDKKTVYVGSLGMDKLAVFRSPIAG